MKGVDLNSKLFEAIANALRREIAGTKLTVDFDECTSEPRNQSVDVRVTNHHVILTIPYDEVGEPGSFDLKFDLKLAYVADSTTRVKEHYAPKDDDSATRVKEPFTLEDDATEKYDEDWWRQFEKD